MASDWLRHFRHFSYETAERNSTKLDRKQDLNVLYQVCVFRADQKNKMAALASDWLRHFRLLLWNRWTEFNETRQEVRSQRPLPSLCFSCRSEKQDGRLGLWLAETFSTSPLKPLNGIQRNLTARSQCPIPSLFLGRSVNKDRGCPNGTNTPRGDNFSRYQNLHCDLDLWTSKFIGHILASWGVCMWSFMMIGVKGKQLCAGYHFQ